MALVSFVCVSSFHFELSFTFAFPIYPSCFSARYDFELIYYTLIYHCLLHLS